MVWLSVKLIFQRLVFIDKLENSIACSKLRFSLLILEETFLPWHDVSSATFASLFSCTGAISAAPILGLPGMTKQHLLALITGDTTVCSFLFVTLPHNSTCVMLLL